MSLVANHEPEGRAVQVPEILEGIGVAVITGTAVTYQDFTCDVPTVSEMSLLAEAEDRFFLVHVTTNFVTVGPN